MKFVIALFAVVAVASAHPGIPWAAPISQPWPAPEPWPAAAPWPAPAIVKVAAAPAYVKVAAPQVHAPEVHQVLQIPQQQSIPPPHPQPLNIKVPHAQATRIPLHGNKIVLPHLIGVEHYVEPVQVVKAAPAHHQPWD